MYVSVSNWTFESITNLNARQLFEWKKYYEFGCILSKCNSNRFLYSTLDCFIIYSHLCILWTKKKSIETVTVIHIWSIELLFWRLFPTQHHRFIWNTSLAYVQLDNQTVIEYINWTGGRTNVSWPLGGAHIAVVLLWRNPNAFNFKFINRSINSACILMNVTPQSFWYYEFWVVVKDLAIRSA